MKLGFTILQPNSANASKHSSIYHVVLRSHIPRGYVEGYYALRDTNFVQMSKFPDNVKKEALEYFAALGMYDHYNYLKQYYDGSISIKPEIRELFSMKGICHPDPSIEEYTLSQESINFLKHISPDRIVNYLIRDDIDSFKTSTQGWDFNNKYVDINLLPPHIRRFFSENPSYLSVALFYNSTKIIRYLANMKDTYTIEEIINSCRRDNPFINQYMIDENYPKKIYIEEAIRFDSWQCLYGLFSKKSIYFESPVLNIMATHCISMLRVTNKINMEDILKPYSDYPSIVEGIMSEIPNEEKYFKMHLDEFLDQDPKLFSEVRLGENLFYNKFEDYTLGMMKKIQAAEKNGLQLSLKGTALSLKCDITQGEFDFLCSRGIAVSGLRCDTKNNKGTFLEYSAKIGCLKKFLTRLDPKESAEDAQMVFHQCMAKGQKDKASKILKMYVPFKILSAQFQFAILALDVSPKFNFKQLSETYGVSIKKKFLLGQLMCTLFPFSIGPNKHEGAVNIINEILNDESLVPKIQKAANNYKFRILGILAYHGYHDKFDEFLKRGFKLENEYNSEGKMCFPMVDNALINSRYFKYVENASDFEVPVKLMEDAVKGKKGKVILLYLKKYVGPKPIFINYDLIKDYKKGFLEIQNFAGAKIERFTDKDMMKAYIERNGCIVPYLYHSAVFFDDIDLIKKLFDMHIDVPKSPTLAISEETMKYCSSIGMTICPFSVGVKIPNTIEEVDALEKMGVNISESGYFNQICIESTSLDINYYIELKKRCVCNTEVAQPKCAFGGHKRHTQFVTSNFIKDLKSKNMPKLRILLELGVQCPDIVNEVISMHDMEILNIFLKIVGKKTKFVDPIVCYMEHGAEYVDKAYENGYKPNPNSLPIPTGDKALIKILQKYDIPTIYSDVDSLVEAKDYQKLSKAIYLGYRPKDYEKIIDEKAMLIIIKFAGYDILKEKLDPEVRMQLYVFFWRAFIHKFQEFPIPDWVLKTLPLDKIITEYHSSEVVDDLLTYLKQVKPPQELLNRLLRISVSYNATDVAKVLLFYKADPNSERIEARPLIEFAFIQGNDALVSELSEVSEKQDCTKDDFLISLEAGLHMEVSIMLDDRITNRKFSFQNMKTQIMKLSCQDPKMVGILIKGNAVDRIDFINYAITENLYQTVDSISKEFKFPFNSMVVERCLSENRLEYAKLLIANHVCVSNFDYTLLSSGASEINNGLKKTYEDFINGCKMLERDVTKYVLKGVSPNIQDREGRTGLWYCVRGGSVESVKELIDIGADPAIASNDGVSPLDIAVEMNSTEIVRMITEKKVKGTIEMVRVAINNNNDEIVSMLLQNHLLDNSRDNRCEYKTPEIAELLIRYNIPCDLSTPFSESVSGFLKNKILAHIKNDENEELERFFKLGIPDVRSEYEALQKAKSALSSLKMPVKEVVIERAKDRALNVFAHDQNKRQVRDISVSSSKSSEKSSSNEPIISRPQSDPSIGQTAQRREIVIPRATSKPIEIDKPTNEEKPIKFEMSKSLSIEKPLKIERPSKETSMEIEKIERPSSAQGLTEEKGESPKEAIYVPSKSSPKEEKSNVYIPSSSKAEQEKNSASNHVPSKEKPKGKFPGEYRPAQQSQVESHSPKSNVFKPYVAQNPAPKKEEGAAVVVQPPVQPKKKEYITDDSVIMDGKQGRLNLLRSKLSASGTADYIDSKGLTLFEAACLSGSVVTVDLILSFNPTIRKLTMTPSGKLHEFLREKGIDIKLFKESEMGKNTAVIEILAENTGVSPASDPPKKKAANNNASKYSDYIPESSVRKVAPPPSHPQPMPQPQYNIAPQPQYNIAPQPMQTPQYPPQPMPNLLPQPMGIPAPVPMQQTPTVLFQGSGFSSQPWSAAYEYGQQPSYEYDYEEEDLYDDDDGSELREAISADNLPLVLQLIAGGASFGVGPLAVRSQPVFNAVSQSVHAQLAQAVALGDIPRVQGLYSLGIPIDVNAGNQVGDTPLHTACRAGRADVAGMLLDLGADPFRLNLAGSVPVTEAALFGAEAVIRLFVERQISVNFELPNKSTVLTCAALSGNFSLFSFLVYSGFVLGIERVQSRNQQIMALASSVVISQNIQADLQPQPPQPPQPPRKKARRLQRSMNL